MSKVKSLLINIVVIAIVYFGVTAYQQRNLLTADNTPAPYFNLPLLQDSQQRMSIAQLQEKTTVVYFFAPWCSICKYSMPNLNTAYEEGSINAIAIALDYKTPEQVKSFANELQLSMPILMGDNHTRSNYKISAYPTYYVINEQLQISARSMGYSSQLGIKVRTL